MEQYLDRCLPKLGFAEGSAWMVVKDKALRTLMERHPHVALVAEASPNEGGAGATVVDLRV